MTEVPGPHRFRLPDGRQLAYDDVGDPSGTPLVYLHGTPDCRWSRHPDDGLAAVVGVRIIAVDRPGYGDSDFDHDGTFLSVADDVLRLADELGVERCAALGWSGGGPFALALAVRAPDRVPAVGVACSLAPIDALDTPGSLDGADAQMLLFADAARHLPAGELARTVAPLLWPAVATHAEARTALLEDADPWALADLDAVPGLTDQLARSALHALEQGRRGMERDLTLLVSPFGFALADVHAHVSLWYGARDGTATLGMGRYLAERLPDADLVEVADGSHFLVFTEWRRILRSLRDTVRGVS